MSVQFDWQVSSESGEWETIAQTRRRLRRRLPRWAWILAMSIVLGLAAGGYVIVRHRYDEARRRIEFQVQNIIDLEAQAFERQDRDLFMAQQDQETANWYSRQETRVSVDCSTLRHRWADVDAPPLSAIAHGRCSPVLPAKVQELDLQGQVAWVEVIEGDPPVRRARFYRQTDQGWKHTAPQGERWGSPIRLVYGNLTFHYHARDESPVAPLVEHVHRVFGDVCATLGCPPDGTLEVTFAVDGPDQAEELPYLADARLTLPSPWLSGIPMEGEQDPSYLSEVTYWVGLEAASQAMAGVTQHPLDPLQRALAAEYAGWYSTQDTDQAPILGQVIERHGADVLPHVLRTVARTPTLTSFLARWLALSPLNQDMTFFEVLINFERQATRVGRKETFLLLQDEGNASWLERQESLFDQVQLHPRAAPQAAHVKGVEMTDGRAKVTVRGVLVRFEGRDISLDPLVFYRLRNGDWKHTSVAGGMALLDREGSRQTLSDPLARPAPPLRRDETAETTRGAVVPLGARPRQDSSANSNADSSTWSRRGHLCDPET